MEETIRCCEECCLDSQVRRRYGIFFPGSVKRLSSNPPEVLLGSTVSFMRVFNTATEAVKQGGTRRGANMGILRIDHPDILKIIACKKDTSDITTSIFPSALPEKFMEAVENREEYDLVDPDGNRSRPLECKEGLRPDCKILHGRTGRASSSWID